MKNIVIAAAISVSAIAFAAGAASAQTVTAPKFYGNLGYTFADGGEGANFGVITGRLGARLHPNFGLEGEAGFGVDGDDTVVSGVSVHTKLRHSFAGYGVAYLPVTPQIELFARGGYGTTSVRASAAGVSDSASNDSWNYGVGAQYSFDGLNGVRVDYTRHDFTNNGGHANAWGVSYVRKF